MASAVARVKYLRIAPRKVRLVADLIRGKTVAQARDVLAYATRRPAVPLAKVLDAAVANAEAAAHETNERVDTDAMRVTRITVDEGPTLRRFQPAPRGRATRIRKRSSHVSLWIEE